MQEMTIKQLSELLNVNEKTIRRTLNKILPEKLKQGVGTRLNELEVTLLKNAIERNDRLSTPDIVSEVKTNLDKKLIIAQAMQYLTEEIDELTLQNKILIEEKQQNKHKVEFFDTVTESTDTMDFSQVAKVLNCGLGRNKIIEFLKAHNVLRANKEPYQKFVDAGYFKIIEQTYEKNAGQGINYKTVVYQKGLEFIRKMLMEYSGEKAKELLEKTLD